MLEIKQKEKRSFNKSILIIQHIDKILLARTFLDDQDPNKIATNVDQHQDDIVDLIIVIVNE